VIRAFVNRPLVKRLLITLGVTAIAELMTGPPGSADDAWGGIHGSFLEPFAFFGLFKTERWVCWLIVALIAYGLVTVWLIQRDTVRRGLRTALRAPRGVMARRPVRRGAMVGLLVLALFLPHIFTDPFWQAAMVEQIAIYVLLATGLNVVVGFAGLLDLGYVAFYAIGAYATAWMTGSLPTPSPFHVHFDPFWAIPVAIGFAMLSGILLGLPTLRLRGDYLAIVTLGFGEIILIFANNLYGITGGSLGTAVIPHPSLNLGVFHYRWGLAPVPYYYLTITFVVLFLIAFSLLEQSRVGRAWTAIREDEVAAESLGINPLKYKVMAFAIGASTAGFAGMITASQSNVILPTPFTLLLSINILVLVIFGGMGSIPGVVLGAIVIQTAAAYLLHKAPAWYQPSDLFIYIGALLIVMMIFRPVGLLPSKRRQREISLFESQGEGALDEVLEETPS
jgi:branched-chain amino acid transport system permease protein